MRSATRWCPIITVIGLTAALLVGGAIVTETVFGLPGIGNLVVSAVLRRDYPVIQGALIVVAGIYVLINLVIDLIYTLRRSARAVLMHGAVARSLLFFRRLFRRKLVLVASAVTLVMALLMALSRPRGCRPYEPDGHAGHRAG